MNSETVTPLVLSRLFVSGQYIYIYIYEHAFGNNRIFIIRKLIASAMTAHQQQRQPKYDGDDGDHDDYYADYDGDDGNDHNMAQSEMIIYPKIAK